MEDLCSTNFLLLKISIGFSLLILISLTIGWYSIKQLETVNNISTEIKESWMPSIIYASDLNTNTSVLRITLLNHIAAQTPDEMSKYEDEQKDLLALISKNREAYEKVISSDVERDLYQRFDKAWSAYLLENDAIIKLSRQLKNDEAQKAARDSRKDFDEASSTLVKIAELNKKGGDEASDRGDVIFAGARRLIWIAIAIAVALGVGIAYMLVNNLVSSLSSVIEKLKEGSKHVSSASGEIAGATTELSSSATQQASALQQAVCSIAEVSATARKSTDNANKTREYASESEDVALKGKNAVVEMINSVELINKSNEDIKSQIESSNKQMIQIVEVINEISNKTKVINDIVFQTKLLSFNASIEAARAGEHGKGFSVVAEEVGNLAQMSGSAADDISSMLEGSIVKVRTIVEETQRKVEVLLNNSKSRVEAGRDQAHQCGKFLEQIVTKASTVKEMAAEIEESSTQQAEGVEQIEKAMHELEQVNNQNTTASHQCSVAGENLAGQARELDNMIFTLVETVEGQKDNFDNVHQLNYQNESKHPKKRAA